MAEKITTGAVVRARARAGHWRGVLDGQKQSGVTVRAFCRKRKIRESAFYYWRRRFSVEEAGRGKSGVSAASTKPKCMATSKRSSNGRRSKASDLFAPVTIVGQSAAAAATGDSGMLEIVLPGDIIVRAPVGTPADEIGQLVAAVRLC